MIRVLLADDHPMFRHGVSVVLDSDPEVDLVHAAATGEEALARTLELLPDVVLMDLSMPGLHGVEATRRIAEACPDVAVVVLTMFDDVTSVQAALRAGARGYLVKGADRQEILHAVHAAAAGSGVFSGSVVNHLASRSTTSTTIPGLTAREHDVLNLMAAGLTNTAIAHRLSLTPKTVRNYISMVLTKLGVDNRDEAIAQARAAGLGF